MTSTQAINSLLRHPLQHSLTLTRHIPTAHVKVKPPKYTYPLFKYLSRRGNRHYYTIQPPNSSTTFSIAIYISLKNLTLCWKAHDVSGYTRRRTRIIRIIQTTHSRSGKKITLIHYSPRRDFSRLQFEFPKTVDRMALSIRHLFAEMVS